MSPKAQRLLQSFPWRRPLALVDTFELVVLQVVVWRGPSACGLINIGELYTAESNRAS